VKSLKSYVIDTSVALAYNRKPRILGRKGGQKRKHPYRYVVIMLRLVCSIRFYVLTLFIKCE